MPTESRRWTVMTWNLQGTKRTDLDRATELIAERSPDVLLLQEVRRPQAAEFGRRLDLVHRWVFKHHLFTPFFPSRAEGAAILTPHRLSDTDHAVVSDATGRRWWRRRIAMWGLVERADHTGYRVINAHLSPHDLVTERHTEADRISAIADRLGDAPPIVVGGDLNDHGDQETLDRLPGTEFVPSPPTNPAVAPTNVLDHVLLPAAATDVELDVPPSGPEWEGLSDHLPVTVSFSLDWVVGDLTGPAADRTA